MNTFYHGDCKFVMSYDIPPESVDLIYLDPPFFTGKIQKGKKWRPEAMEISFDDTKAYWGQHQEEMRRKAPSWLNSIPGSDEFKAYLYYMMVRLKLCQRVLKPTGSIYLHCDWQASHYLKMVMDGIFGVKNFRNEIIWCYKSGSYPKRDFAKKHDTLLRYTKTDNYMFNLDAVKKEYSPTTIARYNKTDKDGRKYAHVHSSGKWRDYYLDEAKQVIEDYWIDIPMLKGNYSETVGYPTQKPVALLERIILASSKKGDTVLDPFCGCGTAIIAAQLNGRQWIGIDISKQAYEVSKGREHQLPLEVQTNYREAKYIPRDLDEVKAMSYDNFEKWANQFYGATKPHPDKEVDGITQESIPIQVKTTKNGIDSPEIHKFNSAIRHHPKLQGRDVKEGIFVSQNGFTDRARQIASEIEDTEGITIHLVTPEEMLHKEE